MQESKTRHSSFHRRPSFHSSALHIHHPLAPLFHTHLEVANPLSANNTWSITCLYTQTATQAAALPTCETRTGPLRSKPDLPVILSIHLATTPDRRPSMTTYPLPIRSSKTVVYRYPAGADSTHTTTSERSPAMASHARVSFTPSPVYSRLPRDDEAYVMRAFARHARRCHSCSDPYAVHRRGGSLCAKGHRRALDVAQYIYNRHGQAYSVVDGTGYKRVQIEIPAKCEAVRSLLKAMERGLRLMKADEEKKTPTSYDRTYYVSPRPVTVHQHNHDSQSTSRTYYKPSAYPTEAPPSPSTSSSSSDSSSDRETFYPSQRSRGEARSTHPKAYKLRPQVYYRPSPRAEPVPVEDRYYWR